MLERVDALRAKLEPAGWLFVRICVGVVMIAHGWYKLTERADWLRTFGRIGIPAPKISIWFAIAGDLGGGLGILLGAATALAGGAVAFSMLTAILTIHLKNGLMGENGGFEYPLVLMSVAIALALRGPGPWSVDGMLAKRKEAAS